MPAAANRLTTLVDQYPLFSQADEALWMLGDSYDRMGDRFEDKSAAAYTRIVKDYPLSVHADAAKKKLAGHEASRAGSRSGGLCAYEIRIGKPERPE